jgi:fructose-1-phosphate kinase PfkB-like protein
VAAQGPLRVRRTDPRFPAIRRTRNAATVVVDAQGSALERALAAGPTLIKPNAEEAAELLAAR